MMWEGPNPPISPDDQLRTANSGFPSRLAQTVPVHEVLLRLRRPIHTKTNGSLRFAAITTNPDEICGLTQFSSLRRTLRPRRPPGFGDPFACVKEPGEHE